MKKISCLLMLSVSGFLLYGCEAVKQMPMASSLTAGSSTGAAAQQDVWADKNGYQADYQDSTDCSIKAKVATKQIMAISGSHKDILGMVGDYAKETMEESSQLESCMLGKGYVKIKVAPGQTLPQKSSAQANSGSISSGSSSVSGGLSSSFDDDWSAASDSGSGLIDKLGSVYKGANNGSNITLKLKVDSFDNSVKAKAQVENANANCDGAFETEGKMSGNVLKLKNTGEACTLLVKFDSFGDRAILSEQNCRALHGRNCAFNGKLNKVN